MDPILDVRGLEVTYNTTQGRLAALSDVCFSVRPGEIVGIVGESGCGKSTVAYSLLSLLPPNGRISAGSVLFDGRDLRTLSAEQLRDVRGREIAMIFQDPMTSLNPAFSIKAQMIAVQQAHLAAGRTDNDALVRRVVDMLEQVGVPDARERVADYPHQFSGGLRQRIMIAMALMSKPALLIADEPTSALDVTLEAQILELIKTLRQAHDTAIVFISHDLGVIAQLCDRVIVMYAGRMVEQGDIYSIYAHPHHPYTRALLASVPSRLHQGQRLATIPGRVPSLATLPPGCKFADRCAQAWDVCRQREPALLAVDGHEVRCHQYDPATGHDEKTAPAAAPSVHSWSARALPPPSDATESSPTVAVPGPPAPVTAHDPVLLRLRGLSTLFYEPRGPLDTLLGRPRQAVHAVDGVDLDIRRGEIVGLVGESGCGKTTLGKTILGIIRPTAGQIIFDGQDVSQARPADLGRLRGRMQMMFQDPCASLSPRLRLSYLLTEPYAIHKTPPAERYSVADLLSMVGLSDEQADKFPHQVSGGQARRIGIARALALHPELLIADEPTSGLDVSVAASIINLMKDLARQLGLTYLIITHNLNVVGYIADRTAVMYLGRMVEVGPTPSLFAAPAHPYTLALLSAISEPDPSQRTAGRRLLLADEIPSPKNPPPGCRFHPRCPFVQGPCKVEVPVLQEVQPGRMVACHRWREVWGQAIKKGSPADG